MISDKLKSLDLSGFIGQAAARRRIKLPESGAAILADLNYAQEIALKNEALRFFWREFKLPGNPEPIVQSPKPRHYRTTSKRRGADSISASELKRRRIPAGAIYLDDDAMRILEPEEHARIFAMLEKLLSTPVFAPLARSLNFVVIRGTYEEFVVIFNLQGMDRALHRLLQRAASSLLELKINVISAFLMIDPSRSPYYLETDRPKGSFPVKRLFGPDHFRLRLGETVFFIPPTSFSQVNESILPGLLASADALLAGEKGGRLLDLYCGYGLFAHTLGGCYREVVAVDAAGASVRAGGVMSARTDRPRIRFLAAAIERRSLDRILPPPLFPGEEDAVLDPPRHGADASVIASIARRRPGRILHIFCAAEEIPEAIGHWRRDGYFVRRIIPLDMFAGTPHLETMILFSRQ